MSENLKRLITILEEAVVKAKTDLRENEEKYKDITRVTEENESNDGK